MKKNEKRMRWDVTAEDVLRALVSQDGLTVDSRDIRDPSKRDLHAVEVNGIINLEAIAKTLNISTL